ncbi:MAG: STM4014 family protein [Actinomycetota bacterium]|nr:STM4014 family protein [Actinomycetota bacterium]
MTVDLTVVTGDDRRWTGFSTAARRFGLSVGRIDWGNAAGLSGPVRLDAVGEDPVVDARWCGRVRRRGEVAGSARWAAGFDQAAREVGGEPVPDPDDLAVLMDKRACHERLQAAGVPVPPALTPVQGMDELEASGWSRVFVKIRHGSSASGVLAITLGGGRATAVGPVEVVDGKLFNSLRLHRFATRADVAYVVDLLAREGLHVERWIPKTQLRGRPVDLRVLCVAGRTTHVVGRAGRGPMTNLHLASHRVAVPDLRAGLGAGFDAAVEAAERAAACFLGCLHVGVDVGVDGRGRPWVFEANAFGDLLPGVPRLDGRLGSTYDAQVEALVSAA